MKQTKRILLQAMMRGYWQAFPSPASDSIRRTFLVSRLLGSAFSHAFRIHAEGRFPLSSIMAPALPFRESPVSLYLRIDASTTRA
jgi:hypothetical protein